MGLSARPLSRYSRCRPSSRTSTAPTARSTRRCLDTCGWASPSTRTRSFTGRSPPARTSRISRRRGSATALNASVVVAARATIESYTHIDICQAPRSAARYASGSRSANDHGAAGWGDAGVVVDPNGDEDPDGGREGDGAEGGSGAGVVAQAPGAEGGDEGQGHHELVAGEPGAGDRRGEEGGDEDRGGGDRDEEGGGHLDVDLLAEDAGEAFTARTGQEPDGDEGESASGGPEEQALGCADPEPREARPALEVVGEVVCSRRADVARQDRVGSEAAVEAVVDRDEEDEGEERDLEADEPGEAAPAPAWPPEQRCSDHGSGRQQLHREPRERRQQRSGPGGQACQG